MTVCRDGGTRVGRDMALVTGRIVAAPVPSATRMPLVPEAATRLRAAARSGPTQVPEVLASAVKGQ
jgi:hypothetical protein